jgi:hypothetical protein
MLLWIESKSSHAYLDHNDEHEKGAKLRRAAARRRLVRSILSIFGCICVVLCQILYERTYRHDQEVIKERTLQKQEKDSKKLRTRLVQETISQIQQQKNHRSSRRQHEQLSKKTKADSLKSLHAHDIETSTDDLLNVGIDLPQNSIYRLTVKDLHGETVRLSQFAGLVSVVVNTACS